jgi:hypothetical protein
MVRSNAFPTDYDVERYLVDDVTADERARIEAAVTRDLHLAQHVAERRAEQQAHRIRHPRRMTKPVVAAGWRSWALSRWSSLGAGVACAVVALVVLLPPKDGVRARGGLVVELDVKRDARTFEWHDGVLLRAGDQVRFTVQSAHGGHLTIVGRDDDGHTSVYYDDMPVPAGTFTLPDSLALDAHVGSEEVLVVVNDAPVGGTQALAALHDHRVPAGQAVQLTWRTEPRP